MKTLVVYYSRTETSKKVAEDLAKTLGGDIERLIDKRNREGVMGYMVSGRDALREIETEIDEPRYSPFDYDLIIIGTPVWAGRMTPAVRTYIKRFSGKFNNVAFFVSQGAQAPRHADVFSRLEDLCEKKSKANLQLSTKQVLKGEYHKERNDFLEKISL